MATIINADTVVGGAQITGDASGVLELQAAGSTKATINGSGLSLASALPVGSGGTGATTLTSNNVILGNGGSAVQFVAPGSNGNVLTSNGTTWTSAAPAGSPALVYLSTTTTSSSANLSISLSSYTSTYNAFRVVCTNINAATTGNSTLPYMRINNAASSYAAAAGGGRIQQGSGQFGWGEYYTDRVGIFYTSIDFISDGNGSSASFVVEFYNMNSSARKFFTGYSGQADLNGTLEGIGTSFGGMYVDGTTPTSLNVVASSNFAATVHLYGIKTS